MGHGAGELWRRCGGRVETLSIEGQACEWLRFSWHDYLSEYETD